MVALALVGGCTPEPEPVQESVWAIGADAIPTDRIAVMADHSGALPVWVAASATGRTVLHVDAHDDFREIPAESLDAVVEAASQGDADTVAGLADNESATGPYNLGNYLYAAARAGVAEHIVWLAPGIPGDPTDPVATWKAWLLDEGYPETDVATFAEEAGAVSGTLLGVPVTLTTLETLPPLPEPVLLDVDVDYFPEHLAIRGYDNATGVVSDLVAGLKAAGVQTDLVTIAKSATYDFTPMQYVWMTDLLWTTLAQPSVLESGPSARWSVMGEAIATEAATGDSQASAWRLASEMAPGDPTAWFGFGRALVTDGADVSVSGEARRALDQAADLDPLFAQGYLQLALELNVLGRFDEALALVERAEDRVEPFAVDLRRADTLYNAGRFDEALPLYERLASEHEQPYVWASLGDTYRHLGRFGEANDSYAFADGIFASSSMLSIADNVEALPYLGQAAEDAASPERAVRYYELYLRLTPEGPESTLVTERLSALGSGE